MAVKLSRKTGWANVKSFLDNEYQIQVNFSAFHSTYYSAYRYTVKEDAEPLLSSPGSLSDLITMLRHNMAAISKIGEFRIHFALFAI